MVDVAGGAPALVDLSILDCVFDRWEPEQAVASAPEDGSPSGGGRDRPAATPEPAPGAPAAGSPEEEQEEPDLSQYEAPDALHRLPYTNSEIIVTVVRSSIGNVKAQIAAEEAQRQRAREEAERRRAEEEAKAAAVDDPPPPAAIAEEASPPSPAPEAPLDRHGKFPVRPRGIFRALFRKKVMSDLQNAAGPSGQPTVTDPDRSAVKEAVRAAAQQQEQEQVECISCFDDFSPKDVIGTACHSYCKECFQRLIANAVENEAQWPPKCCLNPIPHRTIMKHTSADLRRRYEECAEQFSVPVDERVYCALPACGLFVKKSGFRPAERRARCPSGHWTCMDCRQAAHPDAAECPSNEEMQQVQRLAREEGWQRCYRCRNLVEHADACQHMTCRCGAEFCYVCGQRWHTCRCTGQQLADIKLASRRRAERRAQSQEREFREIRERREEAEALRLVEEFEREQARLRERARQEAEARRRAAVPAKYAELGERLDELNSMQDLMLSYHHDRERDLLKARAREAREGLERKQAAKRAETDAAGVGRMAERDRAWSGDYHLRVALERRLEDDYRAQLEAYWAGRPGGDEGARRALRAFQRKNDARFRAWRRRRDGDVERLRWEVEEERAVQEELMAARAARLAGSFAAQGAEMRRKWRAERRWFDLVAAERRRLLRELEAAELETPGEDDDGFEVWHDLPPEPEPEPEEEAVAVAVAEAWRLQRAALA